MCQRTASTLRAVLDRTTTLTPLPMSTPANAAWPPVRPLALAKRCPLRSTMCQPRPMVTDGMPVEGRDSTASAATCADRESFWRVRTHELKHVARGRAKRSRTCQCWKIPRVLFPERRVVPRSEAPRQGRRQRDPRVLHLQRHQHAIGDDGLEGRAGASCEGISENGDTKIGILIAFAWAPRQSETRKKRIESCWRLVGKRVCTAAGLDVCRKSRQA